MSGHIMPTYARLPVNFVKGEGVYLWDDQGKQYLDALAGIAVCNLGHVHPKVTKAMIEQASTLVHTSNLYGIPHQEALADRLCEISGMDKVFFSNSGAEANEASIKLARLYGHRKGIQLAHIIVMENSFHGRTMATLSATGNRKVQAGFEPLVPGFIRVPYNDVEAVRQVAEKCKDVVAILVEPVQGEGGVRVPDKGYLKALSEICEENDWLLMLDEVQTGIGRTGKWFAHQHEGIKPHVMSLAKGLGNGFPIGACLAAGKAAEVFGPGNHGSTYGGNLLGCRTSLEVINTIAEEGLLEHASKMGEYLKNGFREALSEIEQVKVIRGLGMMIGIELSQDCPELVKMALEKGLLINVTAGNTIRLLPPMIINMQQADAIIQGVSELVKIWAADK